MVKKILISAMTAMLLLTAGCEQPPQNNPPPEDPKQVEQTKKPAPPSKPVEKPAEKPVDKPSAEPKEKSMEVTVYYPDEAGMNLVPVKRKITVTNDSDKYLAAVNCLLEAPKEEELTKIFPKGAKIIGVDVEKNTAVVNLDSGITKNFVGGSTGEEFLINSVVDTLTEFKEINQVAFLIDGREVETLAGHMDLSAPIKRDR